jgi:2-amino-4-hydroxy-6-hydroxymethyldihydropteridine diphosphokinase
MKKAILLLGSNLGNRQDYLKKAIDFLKQEEVLVTKISSVYESPAFGYESSSTYYNIALEIKVDISPEALLERCQLIESNLKRVRSSSQRYSDRTIDIDIILFEDKIIDTSNLVVPHPRMHERLFCLKPMIEIASNWIIPTLNKTVKEVFELINDTNEVKKINVKV